MRWILIAMISLQCWCEASAVEAKEPSEKLLSLEECHRRMLADWLDLKYAKFEPPKSSIFDQPDAERKPYPPIYSYPRVRRECRTLSDAERSLLFQGFQYLFTTNDPSTGNLQTFYQVFMAQHRSNLSPGAHFGPCFPGWHREFLLRLENALRQFNSEITLCYWDTTLDRWLPNAAQSALWTAEYFGNGNGYVTTGFAANRPAYPTDCANIWPKLYREVGGNTYLYDDNKIQGVLNTCSYYSFTQLMTPYPNNNFETNHGGVHVFVGGHMSYISCAVLDPVFWFHHTFIDYLWEKCREVQATNKETDYPSGSGIPANHQSTDPMLPFQGYTCINGLSNSYIPGIYTYVPSPRCCTTHADCGGKALWCNNGRCMACVGPGGQMGPNWPNAACLIAGCANPRNINSVCTCFIKHVGPIDTLPAEAV